MAQILTFPKQAVEPANVEIPLKVVDQRRPPMRPHVTAPRKYLEEHEIRAMMVACKSRKGERKRKCPERDALAIYFGWEQGLRAIEIVNTMWSQFNFERMTFTPRRAKGSNSDPNPMSDELADLLKAWRKKQPFKSVWVFTDRKPKVGSCKNRPKGGPPRKVTTDAISTRTLTDIMWKAGLRAGIEFNVHNHQLKHGTGFWHYSKNRDIRATQRWMSHKSLNSTLIYAPMVEPTRDQLPHGK
jgi:integrase